jgi:hypothetical protein
VCSSEVNLYRDEWKADTDICKKNTYTVRLCTTCMQLTQ